MREKFFPLHSADVAEWSCGHVAGAVCAECHLVLVRKANELAAEVEVLRERVAELGKLLKQ